MRNTIRMASLAAIAAATPAFAQSNAITVTVNGNPVQFVGQGPIMNQNRVFVPLRGVFQNMGANVDWNPSTQTVRADRGQTHVRLTIGQLTASVNGQPTNLDMPAQIVAGSTMVPLRFVSEALGGEVDWNAQSQTVAIQLGNYYIPRDRHHPHFAPPPQPPVYVNMPPVIQSGVVIHANFNLDLSSERNHPGDAFEARIPAGEAGLPPGSRVRGLVDSVRRRSGNRPGSLSLRVTTLVLPNGKSVPFKGEITQAGPAGPHGGHVGAGASLSIKVKSPVHLKK